MNNYSNLDQLIAYIERARSTFASDSQVDDILASAFSDLVNILYSRVMRESEEDKE